MSESVSLLAEMLAEAGLQPFVDKQRLTLPPQYDLAYNAATLAMTAEVFGKERIIDGEDHLVLNYLIAKFVQFVCRRPSVLRDFTRWEQTLRYAPEDMFSRTTMPRGFMTNKVFDDAVVLLQIDGQVRRAGRDLQLRVGPDSLLGAWLEFIQSEGLFADEKETILELKRIRITQTKLGLT